MLERIENTNKLLVAIKQDGIAHYNTPDGPDGFELELLRRFAASLELPLELRFYASDAQIEQALLHGEVYLAAGSMIVSQQKPYLYYSTPYHETGQILLYRMGTRKPKQLADMQKGTLVAIEGSHQQLLLENLRNNSLPQLNWVTADARDYERILPELNDGNYELTIMQKEHYELNKAYYPYVLPSLTLSEGEQIAWVFSKRYDDSLLRSANHFLQDIIESGKLATLKKKYFQPLKPKNFVTQRDFWKHTKSRLPQYEEFFRAAADDTGLDWLILAAIGYQESHWNPKAVSPTGVKGIMMLTKAAANQLKLTDRTDPQQSILGGARYLGWKAAKIPQRIQGEDRLWFTLAAYNVGFGHLEDARILTQRQGGNPDLWQDVKQRLPLLSKEKYYTTLKHGKARGREPVTYVENIRYYYRLLSWYYYQSPQMLARLTANQLY